MVMDDKNIELNKSVIKFSSLNKCSDEEIFFLYNLLKDRKYSISHKKMPSIEAHKQFINNNPYLFWYLIREDNTLIGSTYIMDDNSLGIDLTVEKMKYFQDVINFIKQKHKPKPPIKSVRSGKFFVNVSPFDLLKIDALERSKARIIQSTYIID